MSVFLHCWLKDFRVFVICRIEMQRTILVNIITDLSVERCLNGLCSSELILNEFRFTINSYDDNIIWDYIIVFEYLPNVLTMRCKEGGLIYITGEPPTIRSYSTSFLKQFDKIITVQQDLKTKGLILEQILLPMFGYNFEVGSQIYSYEDLRNLHIPEKTKNISIIVSNKNMVDGHKKRLNFVEQLMVEFSNEIDFYGSGVNRSIPDKSEAILPYKFHICIENSCIPYYWTEKIMDPFIGFAIPIYCGCSNITNYYSEKSLVIIDLLDMKRTNKTLELILKNANEYYKAKFPYLLKSRELVLGPYSFNQRIGNIIKSNFDFNSSREVLDVLLKPEIDFLEAKIHMCIYKGKQRFFKLMKR